VVPFSKVSVVLKTRGGVLMSLLFSLSQTND
jgi:hypothetical protein